MSENTIIAWTDHTFNLAWGCTKISPGCKNCYADTLSKRYGHSVWGPNAKRRTLSDKYWDGPLAWNRDSFVTPGCRGEGLPHLVFSSSMCDWAEDHPTIDQERKKLWPLIKATPFLEWQLLTKRADRIAQCLPDDWSIENYPNVWLGVSVENDDYTFRADYLRKIDCVVRFISYEPALGPLPSLDMTGLDWIIYGGESGPGYRKHDLEWPREIERKCADAGVAFFFKQSSAARTEMGIELDGRIVRKFPIPRVPNNT